jgi:hypothetical protein
MIALGVVLLIIGFVTKVAVIWTLGIIAVVVGAVLALLGGPGVLSVVADTTSNSPRWGPLCGQRLAPMHRRGRRGRRARPVPADIRVPPEVLPPLAAGPTGAGRRGEQEQDPRVRKRGQVFLACRTSRGRDLTSADTS